MLTQESAHIPLFLYPFLNTTSKSRPFEYLRLTSLGVIGALVKNEPSSNVSINPSGTPGAQANASNSSPTITFLLTTEIIPLCLRIMETGSELSKTVAIFIVQKILLDDTGLGYICATYERFYAVGTVLSNMVIGLVETQTVRLLKHVVRCFLRFVVLRDKLTRDYPLTWTPDLAIITELVKRCASACQNRFEMQPFPTSSGMMQPPSDVWPNCSST
jgi:hypothetical protein